MALTILTPGVLAQTPEAGETPHPAHIHSGTCDQLGDVVVPLTDIASQTGGVPTGAPTANAVTVSETIVDMPLQALLDGGYAINVHESAENIGTYIACGDIGGLIVPDAGGRDELIIGLGELNDSGHTGVAWLGADGDQTEVVVILIEPEEMS